MKKKKSRRFKPNDRNYDDPIYKKWRKAVAKRDGYKCRWPGCRVRKRLHFHHIRTWAKYPHLRFVVDNGITLCKWHHDAIWGKEEQHERMFNNILATSDKKQRDMLFKIRAEVRQWQKKQKR